MLEVDVPLGVVSWSPQDGAANVCPTWPATVCFNQAIDPAALQNGDLVLGPSSCQPRAGIDGGSIGFSTATTEADDAGNPLCVTLTPQSPLSPGCYTVEAEGADLTQDPVRSADGGAVLEVTVRAVFQVSGSACLGADGG